MKLPVDDLYGQLGFAEMNLWKNKVCLKQGNRERKLLDHYDHVMFVIIVTTLPSVPVSKILIVKWICLRVGPYSSRH